MPAALIPALIMAGGTIGASYISSKAASSAMARTPEEQAALQGQTDLQKEQLRQGRMIFDAAAPASQQALNYYTNILSGDRGKMSAALRPQVEGIKEAGAGAEAGIRAKGLSGGVLRTALGRLGNERFRQIGNTYLGAPAKAAEGLSNYTSALLGNSNSSLGNAGMTGANLVNAGFANRQLGINAGSDSARAFGGLIAQLVNSYGKTGFNSTSPGVSLPGYSSTPRI